ncbi:MAG: tetratricopeptide repeat protein [Blastocatellia bacterium]
MKTLSAILFACCFALTAFGQQLTLNGSLMTDAKAPVPATRVSVHGIENTTDSKGQFKLVLSGDFSEGERIIIKVIKPSWVINYPLDGEWNLPNVRLQNIQTLDVIIVPKGSKALWTHARIEKQIARLSDEIAKLKKEGDTPRPIDFSFYLRQWAEQYGFTPDQVKAAFDDWASAVKIAEVGKDTPEAYRKLGLEAFYRSDFAEASEYFDKAAALRSPRRKRLQEEYDKETLDEYEERKLAGSSRGNEYKFREALASYNLARQVLSELIAKEKHQLEQAEIEYLIGKTQSELARNSGIDKERVFFRTEAVGSYKRALAALTREQWKQDTAMAQNWAAIQANLGFALYNLDQETVGAESASFLGEAVNAYRAALSVYTLKQLPEQWAWTLARLGDALSGQGARTVGGEGVRLLSEAVEVYSRLSVYAREHAPYEWWATLIKLGSILRRQGERTEGGEGIRLLDEAVKTHRAALSVYAEEKEKSVLWALSQDWLGAALLSQGERTLGADREVLLREAAEAFKLSLQVHARKRMWRSWVMAQTYLADTYYALQDWSHAAECYANILKANSRNTHGFQRASSLYQETLFRFSEAFELREHWLETHPEELAVAAAFAESHFTTSRFSKCQERITVLLARPELAGGIKLALRLIEIANLLALGQTADVPYKLDLLIEAVAAQPADFKITWTFNGTLHFIGQSERLAARRDWLKLLFSASEGANREAALKTLREAKAGFKP